MNNDNNNFEDFVKKMASIEPKVPSGLEWENMDIEIPKKKQGRSLLLFLLITLLLIISFLSGYWFYSQVNYPETFVDASSENPTESLIILLTNLNKPVIIYNNN